MSRERYMVDLVKMQNEQMNSPVVEVTSSHEVSCDSTIMCNQPKKIISPIVDTDQQLPVPQNGTKSTSNISFT